MGADQDTNTTKALKNYYEQQGVKVTISSRTVEELNKGIYQAKNDYTWAKANNDRVGMEAAAQVADNMRALGGTISSETTLEQARQQAYGVKPQQTTSSSNSNTVKTVVSTRFNTLILESISLIRSFSQIS